MENQELKQKDQRINNKEKDANISNNIENNYLLDSQNSDDNEKDKPIHFQVEYDKNKNFENQIDSSPEQNKNKQNSKINDISNKKEQQEFIIEKNIQANEKQNNSKNFEYFQENNNNSGNSPNFNYYDLLKDNSKNNNNEEDNLNNYYYYYLNNVNNRNMNNNEEEYEPKKIISFATRTYKGRIDPVKLNRKYNNYWKNQNKSKNKYKEKIDALQKVFHPYGYNTITKSFRKKNMSQSRYSTRVLMNDCDRRPFDNTKQPLPKNSYLVIPYDYGINDPNYGKEDPSNYNRKKMVKLRMVKQPLKYYYPYTNDNMKKKNFKYE